jgi:hypothetical protein
MCHRGKVYSQTQQQATAETLRRVSLFPHQTGRWCKKIRQRLVYYGKIADDPEGVAALEGEGSVEHEGL